MHVARIIFSGYGVGVEHSGWESIGPMGRFLTSPYGTVQECSASLIPTRAGWNA